MSAEPTVGRPLNIPLIDTSPGATVHVFTQPAPLQEKGPCLKEVLASIGVQQPEHGGSEVGRMTAHSPMAEPTSTKHHPLAGGDLGAGSEDSAGEAGPGPYYPAFPDPLPNSPPTPAAPDMGSLPGTPEDFLLEGGLEKPASPSSTLE
jgi:hypothetical protein